jgi:hypothetical protein
LIKNDRRLNLTVSQKIGRLLEEQSRENGMNMSAYLSHLLLQVEKQKESMNVINKMISKVSPLTLESLVQLTKNSGDE